MQWLFFSLAVVILSFMAKQSPKISMYICIVLAIIMGFVVGFGGLDASDHEGYAVLFDNIKHNSFSEWGFSLGRVDYGFEWGFMFLNYFAVALGLGEAGFFCLVAFITNLLIVLVIFRYSKHTITSSFLFIISIFFIQEPNLVRQTLSAAFVLYSLSYLYDKDWWKYAIWIIIAGLIHSSSFFFITLLVLRMVNFDKRRNFVLITLCGLWFISLLFLYGILRSDFQYVASLFVRIRSGVSSASVSDDIIDHNIQHDVMNLLVILVAFYYLVVNKKRKLDVYTVLFFFAPIFYNLGPSNYSLFRFSLYFFPLITIIIPNVLYDFKLGKRENMHLIYYAYVIWNLTILIRSHILSDHPLFFDVTYSWRDFWA